MPKFILRFGVMFLTFTLSIAGNSLFNGLASVVERWIETPEPVLEEPCATVQAASPAANRLLPNCGLLVVVVLNDRSLELHGEGMGGLDNPGRLVEELEKVFKWRSEAHAYRAGLERDSDVPEEERIEKTVMIKAPRSISYGDVCDLIDAVRRTGAKPIGLVTEGSGYPQVTVEQNR